MQDLVGMGWRPELATGILSNLDRIDVLEVIAEDFYETPAGVSATARRGPPGLSAMI